MLPLGYQDKTFFGVSGGDDDDEGDHRGTELLISVGQDERTGGVLTSGLGIEEGVERKYSRGKRRQSSKEEERNIGASSSNSKSRRGGDRNSSSNNNGRNKHDIRARRKAKERARRKQKISKGFIDDNDTKSAVDRNTNNTDNSDPPPGPITPLALSAPIITSEDGKPGGCRYRVADDICGSAQNHDVLLLPVRPSPSTGLVVDVEGSKDN